MGPWLLFAADALIGVGSREACSESERALRSAREGQRDGISLSFAWDRLLLAPLPSNEKATSRVSF